MHLPFIQFNDDEFQKVNFDIYPMNKTKSKTVMSMKQQNSCPVLRHSSH